MNTTVVEWNNVSFAWPDGTPALRDVSLRLETGESVGLLGANGAGKTTLLLLAVGCLIPASGTVRVDGVAVEPKTLADIRRRLGFVFQDADDQLFLPTVLEDVAFGPLNHGMTREEARTRAEETLAAVGASGLAQRPPHRLSGGEKRIAALATALAVSPLALLLDEPTSGLDPCARERLARLFETLRPACLVATHDLPFARAACGRVVVLSEGCVVAEGETADILDDRALLERVGLALPSQRDAGPDSRSRTGSAGAD